MKYKEYNVNAVYKASSLLMPAHVKNISPFPSMSKSLTLNTGEEDTAAFTSVLLSLSILHQTLSFYILPLFLKYWPMQRFWWHCVKIDLIYSSPLNAFPLKILHVNQQDKQVT